MNEITVYTTNTCPYCTMMKNFLNEQNLSYQEINVQDDVEAAQKLVDETGQMGVPQTKVNGNWVLGFDPESLLSFVKK